MNRMLINATHRDQELRIALANGQYLYDLTIESASQKNNKSNIYKGIITRLEPSLEAAFVDYSEGRHGFLPFKEIARSCYRESYIDQGRRPSINEVLEVGQEVIVQVEKEERGNKGAALTTFITLPGCYLVLMPNNPRAGGVSRRIEGDERDELHGVLGSLIIPEGMGLIVRTAGSGRSQEELQWDLDILLKLWASITEASNRPAPFLIYQEGNAVIRAMRDYLRKEIDEILIDHQDVYEEISNHLKLVRPDFVNRVKLYKDPTPLFTRFQIETQIESAFQREVRLPSGGAIIIDHTEALVSIDINSAKSTKGGDIEETAFKTNLEAANEIARQLRLRDIGGLIVIDFIDMTPEFHRREVEKRMQEALYMDRARVQVGRISRFGLLEMSRQRLRTSLGETSRITCPRCLGQGTIRGIESLALSIIRLIEEEAMKDNTAQVRAILPTEIAAYLLNEKRHGIISIETRQNVSVVVVPSNHMLTPQYEVERIRQSDFSEKDEKMASYQLAVKADTTIAQAATTAAPAPRVHQEPAVRQVAISEIPAPAPRAGDQTGIIKKIFGFLFDKKEEPQKSTTSQTEGVPYQQNRNRHQSNRRPHDRRPTRGGRPNQRGGRNQRSNYQGQRSAHPSHEDVTAPISVQEHAMQSAPMPEQHEHTREQPHHEHKSHRPHHHEHRESSERREHREPREHRESNERRESSERREPREHRPRHPRHQHPRHESPRPVEAETPREITSAPTVAPVVNLPRAVESSTPQTTTPHTPSVAQEPMRQREEKPYVAHETPAPQTQPRVESTEKNSSSDANSENGSRPQGEQQPRRHRHYHARRRHRHLRQGGTERRPQTSSGEDSYGSGNNGSSSSSSEGG